MPCGGIGNEWKTQVSKFLDSVVRSAYYVNLNIEQVKVFELIMFQLLYSLQESSVWRGERWERRPWWEQLVGSFGSEPVKQRNLVESGAIQII